MRPVLSGGLMPPWDGTTLVDLSSASVRVRWPALPRTTAPLRTFVRTELTRLRIEVERVAGEQHLVVDEVHDMAGGVPGRRDGRDSPSHNGRCSSPQQLGGEGCGLGIELVDDDLGAERIGIAGGVTDIVGMGEQDAPQPAERGDRSV